MEHSLWISVLGQIEKGINPDIIGAISPKRKFALAYKGEIVAQGNRYDKAYQKTLMELKRASHDIKKIKNILEDVWQSKSFQLIEIFEHRGSPIGEFDHIFHNKRIFVEDKSAQGLLKNINPQTGKPWQTFESWANKQVYEKTYNRIKALEVARKTRARLPDGLSPDIAIIIDIRNL